MIQVLVLEDEIPARKKLVRLLGERQVEVQEAGTVKDARALLEKHSFDVIVSDIELLDGNVFTLYSEIEITCPILFTTAYDQFWTNAFDTRGIDYLLKPFSAARFAQAWEKFMWLREGQKKQLLSTLKEIIHRPKYKERFAVPTPQGTFYLLAKDISYIEAEEGVVFAYDAAGNRNMLAIPSLKEMEEQLDPVQFFRINRSEIVQKNFIEKTDRYDKNSLLIYLRGITRRLKTSQSATAAFRAWLEE